jgi:CheY-like chemotaxis protein
MKSLFRRAGTRGFLRGFLPSSSQQKTPVLAETRQMPDLTERRKILIVDDDAVILKALSLKLESEGYAVATAVDGADALRGLREEKPDLVLLDIVFPPDIAHGGGVPWDGFLLMRWLRGIEKVGNVPVLFMTGNDPGGYRERALACGATGLFHKPIDPNVLLAAIERILNGSSTGPFDLDANFQI